MEQAKKPWQSKTIILNAVLGVAALLAVVDPSLSEVVKHFVADKAAEIGMIWSVLNIILRTVSKERISLGE